MYKSKTAMLKYGVKLLNRIINECEDLTPTKTENEKYSIDGELHSEVYNYLINNDLKKEEA